MVPSLQWERGLSDRQPYTFRKGAQMDRPVSDSPLDLYRSEVEHMADTNTPFGEVKDAINAAELAWDEKTALWMLAWSLLTTSAGGGQAGFRRRPLIAGSKNVLLIGARANAWAVKGISNSPRIGVVCVTDGRLLADFSLVDQPTIWLPPERLPASEAGLAPLP
jgi:hypothetical protein